MKTCYYVTGTLVFYLVIIVISLPLQNVDVVLNFASAISITALAFVFPAAFLIRAEKKFGATSKFDDSSAYRYMAYLFIVFGFLNFCICMTSEGKLIYDMIQ